MHPFRFELIGENSLMIICELQPMRLACTSLHNLSKAMSTELPLTITEQIPAYNNLLLCFQGISASALILRIEYIIASQQHIEPPPNKVHNFPVCYHPTIGIDLESLARGKDLSISEIISLHSEPSYQVYAIGFAPGFAYLGDVDARLATKRHATPRPNVPAGSVAIADNQTAIYPCQSPGGWQIIGRSPAILFDIQQTPPCPIQVGDTVQFSAISLSEFKAAHIRINSKAKDEIHGS